MKKTFYINPVPASRPRVTRWSTYFPKRYTEFKKTMEVATGNTPFIPFENSIYAQFDFFVGMPKSWSKKKKNLKIGTYCDNNSDIDNYCKAIMDSLNGVYYKDDKQIVMIKARMFWTSTPRIECELTKLEEVRDDTT